MHPSEQQNAFLTAGALPRENSGVRSSILIEVANLEERVES
jgi:hypothetical protein